MLYWNTHEASGTRFCNILLDLIHVHRLDFVFLSEPKVNEVKADDTFEAWVGHSS